MIPRISQAELTAGEWTVLRRLMRAPALWAFHHLAGMVGLDAAVEHCKDRDSLPHEQVAALEVHGWAPQHLPEYEVITAAMFGCRVFNAQTTHRKRDGRPLALEKVAERFGVDRLDAAEALRVAESYTSLHHEGDPGM